MNDLGIPDGVGLQRWSTGDYFRGLISTGTVVKVQNT